MCDQSLSNNCSLESIHTLSSINASTSRFFSFLFACTCLIISLARPFDTKFSFSDISKTNETSPISSRDIVAAAKFSFSTLLNSISSIVISYPSKIQISASISSRILSGSAFSSNSNTAGKSCLHFLPNDLRFGAISILWNLSRSSSVVSSSTFNSSANIS